MEIEKKSGKKTTWKNLFFIYFYFSKRRKQFRIGLLFSFLGCCWTVAAGHGNLAGQSEISRLSSTKKQTDRMKK
jgi:hypothetical protein